MTVRRLNNNDLDKAEKFLSQHSATSMFLRNNISIVGFNDEGKRYQGLYLGSFDDNGDITGILGHFWNNNIIVQSPNEQDLQEILSVLKETTQRPIAGILGPKEQMEFVQNTLDIDDDDLYAKNSVEDLYTLNLDGELQIPSRIERKRLRVIPASDANYETLFEWNKAYDIEALGAEDNEALNEEIKDHIEKLKTGKKDRWVLLVDDEPVSMVGYNARLTDSVSIGPVWTPVEHRGKGYARTLLALCLEASFKQNINEAILFTDNPGASKAYTSIGFKRIGYYGLSLLKQPMSLSK